MKLTGLSLKLFTTPLTISRYTALYSWDESRILGKNTTTQSGIERSTQFDFHLSYESNLYTKNPLLIWICYLAQSAIAEETLAP